MGTDTASDETTGRDADDETIPIARGSRKPSATIADDDSWTQPCVASYHATVNGSSEAKTAARQADSSLSETFAVPGARSSGDDRAKYTAFCRSPDSRKWLRDEES